MHFLFLTTVQIRYPHSVTFMKSTSVALFSQLLVSTVAAQSADTPSAPSQQKSGPASGTAKSARDFSQEPLVYESIRAKMRFENDGTGVRDVTARIRVQTPRGLAKAGQLVLDYQRGK
jgi:hypothetical protein